MRDNQISNGVNNKRKTKTEKRATKKKRRKFAVHGKSVFTVQKLLRGRR